MILSDREIEKAIREKRLVVSPGPDSNQYDSSALNLRVGGDFRTWKASLRAKGTRHRIDLDEVALSDLEDYTDRLAISDDGIVVIPPAQLILVRTLESVYLPSKSKLAARVEGRSKQARLGMTAHISAPTIHAGFSGHIVLEIFNHGPFDLEVRPGVSKLCQLIVEEVKGVPKRGGSTAFSHQETPLGTPKTNRR